MQARTICCKLSTTPENEAALQSTSFQFAKACNYVLTIAIKEKTYNAIQLHKLCYKYIRELFSLSASQPELATYR